MTGKGESITNSSSEGSPGLRLAAYAVIVIALAVGLSGIGLGLAQDRDSAAIELVLSPIRHWHYLRSRSWGDPLYEILAAWLEALGGRVLVNLASVAFTMIYAGAVYRIIQPARNWRCLLAFAAAILNPLVLSNSSAMMETAFYVAAAAVSLACLLAYLRQESNGAFLGFLAAIAVMILARPDSALFAIVIASCLALEWRKEPRQLSKILIGLGLTSVIVAGVYIALNHGIGFLTPSVLGGKSLGSRASRAILALIAIYGVIGVLTLVALSGATLYLGRAQVLRSPYDHGFLDRLALATVLVYLPRFFLLPDQLEYFILPLIMSIIFLSRNLRSGPALTLILLSITLNSVVEIALFTRDGRHIVLAPELAEGAVAQDWDARKLLHAREDLAFQNYIATAVYGASPSRPALRPDEYLDGFLSSQNDLVIGQSSAYQIGDPAFGNAPAYQASNYRRIYVCDADLAPRYAWRVLQPSPSLEVVKRFHRQEKLSCHLGAI